MTSLELAGRFPPDADLDAAWRVGVEAFRPPYATNTRKRTRSTS
jgi:hypothetical protein